jgi:hypothetical protein
MIEVGSVGFDRLALAEPPAELREIARKETAHHRCGYERRRERRYSLITNVIAVPLDENGCPAGEPFIAISSGMSTSGMRLIHTCPAPSGLLFLEIDEQPVRLLLTVLRSRPVGPCFEIAGRLGPVDLAEKKSVLPNLSADDRQLVTSVEGAVEPSAVFSETDDELIQWAGVMAAVPLIKPEWESHDRSFQIFAGGHSSH